MSVDLKREIQPKTSHRLEKDTEQGQATNKNARSLQYLNLDLPESERRVYSSLRNSKNNNHRQHLNSELDSLKNIDFPLNELQRTVITESRANEQFSLDTANMPIMGNMGPTNRINSFIGLYYLFRYGSIYQLVLLGLSILLEIVFGLENLSIALLMTSFTAICISILYWLEFCGKRIRDLALNRENVFLVEISLMSQAFISTLSFLILATRGFNFYQYGTPSGNPGKGGLKAKVRVENGFPRSSALIAGAGADGSRAAVEVGEGRFSFYFSTFLGIGMHVFAFYVLFVMWKRARTWKSKF